VRRNTHEQLRFSMNKYLYRFQLANRKIPIIYSNDQFSAWPCPLVLSIKSLSSFPIPLKCEYGLFIRCLRLHESFDSWTLFVHWIRSDDDRVVWGS
jgi:hypothetical protein